MDTSTRIANFEQALRGNGIRLTRQRRALLQVLAAATDHPDANELHRRGHEIDGTLSLSTVYRTLTALEDQGVIQRHVFKGAPARFETTDAPHHDHIIDVDTGRIIEFQSEKIERLQAEIAAELGYDLVYHRLELYGRRKD
jgi:Fur family ferric uptake transcriptional regulator